MTVHVSARINTAFSDSLTEVTTSGQEPREISGRWVSAARWAVERRADSRAALAVPGERWRLQCAQCPLVPPPGLPAAAAGGAGFPRAPRAQERYESAKSH